MSLFRRVGLVAIISLVALILPVRLFSQTDAASVVGIVRDPQGAVIPDVEVQATRLDTGVVATSVTNDAGFYVFSGLQPGHYRLVVHKDGFKQVVEDLLLSVQDKREQDFSLTLGSVSETLNVEASAVTIDTQDATVGTLVDRQFVENIPLNGRSFQSLIELAPGVLPTAGEGNTDTFVVNGQRETSNYWTVDGVSANFGIGANIANPGAGLGGQTAGTSLSGGTNSLVSVDALQEFRIETSTAGPDSGLTAGGQISIVTRSGTNDFHGSLFDYFRNEALDANNWFNGINILNPTTPLPKPEERQNDFGGTLGGPIHRDRVFFFFSYEGLRLRLPQTALTQVPDLQARQDAIPAVQQFLNAYPFDPKQPDLGDGVAQFNATYSNPSSLDAYSLRIDDRVTSKLNLFGRYNYSPSSIRQQGAGLGVALSQEGSQSQTIQTFTAGTTWSLSPTISDDFRFNYSRLNVTDASLSSDFGGATPITSPPFPDGYNLKNASIGFAAGFTSNGYYDIGTGVKSLQRQIELVDNVGVQKGSHKLEFGADYRRLSPRISPPQYTEVSVFFDYPTTEAGMVGFAATTQNIPATFLFRTFSLFAQDTWQPQPRLTVTYGLRWGVEFPPKTIAGPPFPALENFNTSDFSQIALAPAGTGAYQTNYANFSPRVGVAYQLTQRNGAPSTVLRGGFGVYYDLAAGAAGNLVDYAYPYAGISNYDGSQLPADPSTGATFPLAVAPPPIVPPGPLNSELLLGFDPHFKTPYTLEWNVALQQELGKQQAVTVSYVGAAGRRLVQTIFPYNSPPASYPGGIGLFYNGGSSSYNALQAQFQRQISHGLQALISYTLAHSIDTGSTVFGQGGLGINDDRGPSNFDIRNQFSAALTYDFPSYRPNQFVGTLLSGWSVQSIVKAYSSPPVDVTVNEPQSFTQKPVYVRPDVVPGIPFYLYGSQYPGGKIINNTSGAATCPDGSPSTGPFCIPPTDADGNVLSQGDLGRNALRGFPSAQWDFAIHRDFPIHESLVLQFRAEMFNVLNHPNFAPPNSTLNVGFGSNTLFGYSLETLGQYLGGNSNGGGALSPLYQFGGPRSIQLALKLSF